MSPSTKAVAVERARQLRQTQTPAEMLFWNAVRRKKLNGLKIDRQYPFLVQIDGQDMFFIFDFYIFAKKLVIEIDGECHLKTKERDAFREEILKGLGLTIIRFSNDDVITRISEVLDKINKVVSDLDNQIENHSTDKVSLTPPFKGRGRIQGVRGRVGEMELT